MKILNLGILLIILSACGIDKEVATTTQNSENNSGSLDLSFAGVGYVSFDNAAGGNSNDEVLSVAIDSQDRLVAVGQSINGSSNPDLTIWRVNQQGELDTGFSSDGIYTLDSVAGGNSVDIAYGVALDTQDNIYITGSSYNGSDYDMFVIKVTSTGALDSSFNGTGVFISDQAAGGTGIHDQGSDIYIDSANQVWVTGYSDSTLTNRDMAVWKLRSNGTLDTSFSGDGIFIHDSAAGGEDDNGESIITNSSGQVYVVGRSDPAGQQSDMAIWKISASGTLDTSFNGVGYFTQDGAAGSSNFDSANQVALDSEENLYITGQSRNSSGNNDMVVWKITSNGQLDSRFGSNGYQSFDVSNIVGIASNDVGEDLLIDNNGRIVVTGSGNEDMCIWRLNTDGSLDDDFSLDGFYSHDSAAGGFSVDSGHSIGQDSQNRLYIGGSSENTDGDTDASFWRLQ